MIKQSKINRESTFVGYHPAPAGWEKSIEDTLRHLLSDVRVFVSYGLLRQSLQSIDRVLAINADHPEAIRHLRRLRDLSQDHNVIADELVRLAHMTWHNAPFRAARYLFEALVLVPQHNDARQLLTFISGSKTPKHECFAVTESKDMKSSPC